jgi:prepilin-type N-terminal cleavage/methylation domain-containing protein
MKIAASSFARGRAAFTLVELLTVIAIIGVLVALLLPAVQGARESSRVTQCASHLRQPGIATHSFHDNYGRFPPGYLGPVPQVSQAISRRDEFVGALVYLLPFLEQQAVFAQIDTNLSLAPSPGAAWWTSANSRAASANQPKVFVCPSTAGHRFPDGAIHLINIYPEEGKAWIERWDVGSAAVPVAPGRTSYLGVAGQYGNVPLQFAERYEGVFGSRTKHRFTDVSDGTSNVLLFGEVTGGKQPGFLRSFSWIGSGIAITNRGLSATETTGFYSEHARVVQFCLADGSVRKVSTTIDRESFLALSGKHDGQKIAWEAVF